MDTLYLVWLYLGSIHFLDRAEYQVPTKLISSGKIFGRVSAMPQVHRASLIKESQFY